MFLISEHLSGELGIYVWVKADLMNMNTTALTLERYLYLSCKNMCLILCLFSIIIIIIVNFCDAASRFIFPSHLSPPCCHSSLHSPLVTVTS